MICDKAGSSIKHSMWTSASSLLEIIVGETKRRRYSNPSQN